MGMGEGLKGILGKVKANISKQDGELQPRDIFTALLSELKKRKKFGIEDQAYVPNVFTVCLCPYDYEEILPLIEGVKDQLKDKVEAVIRKKGYKILSADVSIEIKEDGRLQKNQIVVNSTFVKKEKPAETKKDKSPTLLEKQQEAYQREEKKGRPISPEPAERPQDSGQQTSQPVLTRIMEEKKTTIIEKTKVSLRIIEDEGMGDMIDLKAGEHTFGRGKEADYLIRDAEETVSRAHFKIKIKDGHVRIEDLKSANGTLVNDIEIQEVELKPGDVISAGKVQLKVMQ